VGWTKKEIKAVLHLPESEHAINQFEKKICDFYVAQVEQKLHSLPKDKKLEVLDIIISSYILAPGINFMPGTSEGRPRHEFHPASS